MFGKVDTPIKEDFIYTAIKNLLFYVCTTNEENLKNLKSNDMNIIFKIIDNSYQEMILVENKKILIRINSIFQSLVQSENSYFIENLLNKLDIIGYLIEANLRPKDLNDDEIFMFLKIFSNLWFIRNQRINKVYFSFKTK